MYVGNTLKDQSHVTTNTGLRMRVVTMHPEKLHMLSRQFFILVPVPPSLINDNHVTGLHNRDDFRFFLIREKGRLLDVVISDMDDFPQLFGV
ncbi:hypothetical protein D3C78_1167810 [compost metagenome]